MTIDYTTPESDDGAPGKGAPVSTKRRAASKPKKSASRRTSSGPVIKKPGKARPAEKAAEADGVEEGPKTKTKTKKKKLVIVESPAKARTINKYLGDDYIVQASMGHVRDLPKKEFGVDIEHGFEPKYALLPDRNKNFAALRKAAANAEAVYLATDPDREGEAIAWHLAEALKVPPELAHRVTFNEITKSAVKGAFTNPARINMDRVNAQQARRILDRIVGYLLSPLLWKKVRRGLSAGRVQSVATRLIVEREREIAAFKKEEYWSVLGKMRPAGAAGTFDADLRTVTRPVIDHEICPDCRGEMARAEKDGKAILRCGAEACGKTYELTGAQAAPQVTIDLWIPSEAEKNRIIAELDGREYVVTRVDTRPVSRKAPPPFNTSSLQQAASTRFNFPARRTMAVAQQLYEGVDIGEEGPTGLISYMRTDSFRVADSAIDAARATIEQLYGKDYLPAQPNRYASKSGAQDAHEAVRPTDPARTPDSVKDFLSGEQLRLYTLIWQRFTASQMPPAEYEATAIDIAAGAYGLRARGRRLLFPGFLRVYGELEQEESDAEGKKAGEEKDQALPKVSTGDRLGCDALEATQHFTEPPPRYTEAALVRTLEKEGIGRPSTYASIIGTIQDRGYARKDGRAFAATELGMLVTDKLVAHFGRLVDVSFTRKMESELDEIESASRPWRSVLKDFYEPFKKELDEAQEKMPSSKGDAAKTDQPCPVCGTMMVVRYTRRGETFLGCPRYPECKGSAPTPGSAEAKLQAEAAAGPDPAAGLVCPTCGAPVMVRRSRFGAFLGCTKYPECRGKLPMPGSEEEKRKRTKLVLTEEILCEKCNKPMTIRWTRRGGRRPFLACTGYPECKNAMPLPKGKVISRTEGEGGVVTEEAYEGEKKKEEA
jgi:DNA topoisomerase I